MQSVPSFQRLFLGGEWVEPSSGEVAEVVNPATEEPIATAPVGAETDFELAVTAARRAFDEGPWPRLRPAERAATMRAFHAALAARADDIAALVVAEAGATVGLARSLHVAIPLNHLAYAAEMAGRDPVSPLPATVVPRMTGGKLLGSQVKVHEPIGVVAAITAFNYPFLINLGKVGPALAMGNTVILKPSPFTPLSALILGEAATEAGLPPGALNIVTGGAEVGQLLTTDPRIDMVSFTGSDSVGSAIMGQASSTLKKVVLELGGKSALIVRADADLETATASGLVQFTAQAGQGCALCTRHLVHRSVKDAYVARLAERAGAVKVGDPTDPTVGMGPLIRAAQRERVESYVAGAREDGAIVATGGKRPPIDRGFFYEPTLLDEVDNSWTIAQDEVFGPVAVVIGFDDDDEAIRIANDSRFGLSGAIFSADSGTAYEMALQIRTGGLSINGGSGMMSPHAPFGGYKRSGLGREYGEDGVLEYTQIKTISFNAG